MGTIGDYPPFSAEEDCEALHSAMKGLGTDEDVITGIITNRSNEQRQEMKELYGQMFGKDLESELKSELGGHYEDVVLALFKPPVDYLASELHHAIKGAGTNEHTLIEILCTKTNQEIEDIKVAYNRLYDSSLVDDIDSDTSGYFGRLMYSLAQAARSEEEEVDFLLSEDDANDLIEAGEAQWGTDESRFNVVFASRSYAQLAAMFESYERLSEKTIEEAIENEMSGDVKEGMLAIIDSVKSKERYFAKRLYNSMKGAGTDDRTLIRVMVSRSEVDLVEVKAYFEGMYEQSLEAFINDDCSGDYRKCLLLLALGNQ